MSFHRQLGYTMFALGVMVFVLWAAIVFVFDPSLAAEGKRHLAASLGSYRVNDLVVVSAYWIVMPLTALFAICVGRRELHSA